jgi:wyosine [tRNA(Phe)-imidazoG37] synthetase (radical SAM superfamily)
MEIERRVFYQPLELVDSVKDKISSVLSTKERIDYLAFVPDGELVTETMLVKGINDNGHELAQIADFIALLKPSKAYLAIPIRPPAGDIEPADEMHLNMAYQIFTERLNKVECLIGYEGNAFAATGDTENDLLSITAVHPMREDAVAELLEKNKADWSTVFKMMEDGRLVELHYGGKRFYTRQFKAKSMPYNEKNQNK